MLRTRYNTYPNHIQYSRTKNGQLYVWRKTGCMEGAVNAAVPYFRACILFYFYFLFSFCVCITTPLPAPPTYTTTHTYNSHVVQVHTAVTALVWFQTLPLLSIPSANQKVQRRIVICPADSCIKGNPPHCRACGGDGQWHSTHRNFVSTEYAASLMI